MVRNRMRQVINSLILQPKKLFLIDGLGACLTTFFLLAILIPFEQFFGMPRPALIFLSVIALCYALFSFGCYYYITENWKPFLNIISIANLAYCFITAGFVIYFYSLLTTLGVTYFLLEISLICGLVTLERLSLK